MDASSLVIASSPLGALSSPGMPPAESAGEGVRGADFANLLSHLMDPAGRQDLAAAGAPGLQSLSLSPNIEVITADEPLPDSQSLLAFARSQGLDDAMIHTLFLPGGAAAPAAAAPAAAGSPLAAASASSAMLTAVQAAPAQALGLASTGLVLSSVGSALASEPDQPPLSLAGLAALAPQAMRKLEVQLGAPLAAPGTGDSPDTAQSAIERAGASAQTGLPSLQDVLRLSLRPQEQITQRLASLAASGQQAVWGSVAGSAAGGSGIQPSVLSLDLSGLPSVLTDALAADAESLSPASELTHSPSHPGHALEGSRSQAGAGQTALNTPQASTAAERAAQYEQLAQRLGQALGERLQAQIERGEWKVRMQVDPASLGRIDMELDMRAGALEAVFRSDNQVTRDLISQGLPRLRESLTQSGTAVANVWVQGDSSRQSGGNPTPWRGASVPARPGDTLEEEAPLATAPAARPRVDGSAWDMLV